MSMCNWDEVDSDMHSLADPPPAVQLALAVLPEIPIPGRWEGPAIERLGMSCVPLEEYDIHEDIADIFAFLTSAGSTRGYVASVYGSEDELETYRRFDLTERVANQIKRDRAMDSAMAFVDDKLRCAIVTWWSDYALLGMRADLFESYLRGHPLEMGRGLRSDLAAQFPIIDTLADAKHWALERRRIVRTS
jgi:hypothetical protein